MSDFKILAIKFKFLGDVAICIPAMRSLHEHLPDAEIHWLVAEGAMPIIEHVPWIDKVWGLPRKCGYKQLKTTFPLIRQLQKEQYDLSVDFVGNDRGALVSLLSRAEVRLGPDVQLGFLGRKHCYTHSIPEADDKLHESLRDIHILSRLNILPAENIETELHSDPALKSYARKVLPSKAIICHLSTTRPKKEWPLVSWAQLFNENPQLQNRFVFISGPSERERTLLKDLLKKVPTAQSIETIPSLSHFMALVDQADALVCSDSFPSHLASGLKTPAVVFFGPTTIEQWEPKGKSIVLQPKVCHCLGHSHSCLKKVHCLSSIQPHTVIDALGKLVYLP